MASFQSEVLKGTLVWRRQGEASWSIQACAPLYLYYVHGCESYSVNGRGCASAQDTRIPESSCTAEAGAYTESETEKPRRHTRPKASGEETEPREKLRVSSRTPDIPPPKVIVFKDKSKGKTITKKEGKKVYKREKKNLSKLLQWRPIVHPASFQGPI